MKWWLSFSDDTGPLGVAIVEADDHAAAMAAARHFGCDAGDECVSFPLSHEGHDDDDWIDSLPMNRLIPPEALREKCVTVAPETLRRFIVDVD